MRVRLKYGREGLAVEVPGDATVLTPQQVPGLADEPAAIREALRRPIGAPALREMVRPTDTVVIVFSDITRPMPNDRVLPVLLAELEEAGVPREQITLLNGTGTHRANTPEELREMLGAEVVAHYRVTQHDAFRHEDMVDLGETPYGRRVLVNRLFQEASFRIVTGFIEPHIFAGFSGGPKGVCPGIAGIDLIMANHGYQMLAHERATWGETEGNPIWEEMSACARLTRPDFLLNVTLNARREITGVFAGELWEAHARGVEFVRRTAMVGVEAPFDVVLTTNSGYPLDINLYQSVKGISSAAQVVKPGGSIVIATECRDGIPDYGEYGNLVREGGTAEGILRIISQPGFHRHDQWEAQLHADLLNKAEIHVYSDGLSDRQIEEMLLHPSHDVEETVAALLRRHGPGARLCVLPEGPQTIPYVRNGR